ncbi:immunodominant staphylococcal antigen IsaB family protein [Macrococcus animalis]|uniref:immunodominant staphylococcal antigen IsaB family protein n=1 Tax=Macrococcus animalis TaxID=3395467 RepID=UPI0039BDE4D6
MNKVFKSVSTLTIASSLLLGTAAVAQPAQAATKSVTPYYTYKGYVKNNTKFLLDKNFVRALKYDNFKINGYKLNLKGKPGASKDFMKYDTYYYKDKKNRVTMIRPLVGNAKQVTLKAFLKAHKGNKLVKKGKGEKPNMYEVYYKTNGAEYMAMFQKGYLTYFEYGIYEK